jgi:WD40 repeat protein
VRECGGNVEPASKNITARLWDLTARDPTVTSVVLRGHPARLTNVAFSPGGRWIVTASGGAVRLWPTSLDEMMELGRKAAGRELTGVERKQYLLEEIQ